VGKCGEPGEIPPPLGVRAPPDIGLTEMIEYKPLIRQRCCEIDRRRELTRIHQDVVRQTVTRETTHATTKPIVQQKVVGFSLNYVADANESSVGDQRVELAVEVSATQIDPADDAHYEGVFRGELQQPAGFLEALPNLHRNARIHSCGPHLGLGRVGEEIATKWCE
jgi:hypothetical protein